MVMNIQRKKTKDLTTLVLDGELTIYTVAQVKDMLFADKDSITDQIAVNLEKVAELDTAGIQLLLFAKSVYSNINKNLFISSSNELVDSVLDVFDVANIFQKEA
jgi:anti-sigma B factor antagonist